MKARWFVAVCTLLAVPAAVPVRALDFTLSTKSVEEDGYPRQVSFFTYDARTSVIIRAPATWRITTTPDTLVMSSPVLPGAEVRLEKSLFAPAMPFQGEDLKRYRQAAQAQAPPGSTEVVVTGDKENPLPILDWTGHEFILEYAFYGQRFKRSVLFLNLDNVQQLRVTAVGAAADFDRVQQAAYKLMQSWQASSSVVEPPPG